MDGKLKKISTEDDVAPGMIVRELNEDGTSPHFSDTIVLKKLPKGPSGDQACYLVARPYGFASGVGTTCPSALLGCETFEIRLSSLRERYATVTSSRGRPMTCELDPALLAGGNAPPSQEETAADEKAVTLQEICEEAGIRVSEYSGRCMHGKKCLGVYSNSLGELMEAILVGVEGRENTSELQAQVGNLCVDSMGLGIVVYFPGVEFVNNDEADAGEEEDWTK